MNLEELRAVQSDERGTDSLQSLPDSFYRDVADYLADLRAERERAAESADNPFDSEEVRRLSDEIEAAEEVVEAIYERRVGKVVKRASLAAAGMAADDEGLTDEEAALFDDLVGRIEENRDAVLAAIAGEGEAAPGDTGDAGDAEAPSSDAGSDAAADADEGFDAGAAMGGGSSAAADARPDGEGRVASAPSGGTERPAESSLPEEVVEDDPASTGSEPAPEHDADRPDDRTPTEDADGPEDRTERMTVRITRDVGEVFGIDERTYQLDAEDVVTLPAANAEPLLDRDAAQRLE